MKHIIRPCEIMKPTKSSRTIMQFSSMKFMSVARTLLTLPMFPSEK